MILCVTLNSCLDKTLIVPRWRPGENVRGLALREVVGGKGNNVARALKRLGREVRPVTFLGGAIGKHCAELLRHDDKLDPVVIWTEAMTRVILTVRTQSTTEQTAFFDPDPVIDSAASDELVRQVEGLLAGGAVSALTLSGSSPSPATHGVYSDLISLARARRIPVFLDTYGPALEAIWGFWPTVIQLNRREAAGLLKKPSISDEDVLRLLSEWRKHGVVCGVVTHGPEPAFIQCRELRLQAIPPAIQAVNPIGSGDSLLAGLVDAWLQGADTEDILRHGFACAAANAETWDAGAIDPDRVRELEREIVLEPIQRSTST